MSAPFRKIIFTAILVFAFCFATFADTPYESYGKISWEEEKVSLTNLAIDLDRDKNLIARLSLEVVEKTPSKDIIDRLNNIYLYLTNKRKVDRNRISFDISKKSEEHTVYFVMESHLKPPGCENCYVIEGKEFKQKIKKLFSKK